jgi:hypothetical protein
VTPTLTAANSATVSLTLTFPKNFRVARASAASTTVSSVRPSAKAGVRTALYVNPTSGYTLSIYVDGSPSAQSFPISVSGGTQTVSFSLLGGTHSVVVKETDANGDLLASGSQSGVSVSPGSSTALTITMSMNASAVVLTTNTSGSDATVLSTSSGSPTAFCVFSPTAAPTLYAQAADLANGFVLPGPSLGVPTSTLTSQTSSGSSLLYVNPGTWQPIITPQPNGAPISATFQVLDLNNITHLGYATIGNAESVPCQVFASFSPTSVTIGGTSTLTITGGSPPYAVTEADGNCTYQSQNAPLNSIYTATSVTGSACTPSIFDANATTPATSPTLAMTPLIYFAGASGVQACDENGNSVGLSGFSIGYGTAITYDTYNARFFIDDITSGGHLKVFSKWGVPESVSGFAAYGGGQNQLVYNPSNNHIYAAWNNNGNPDVLEWDAVGNSVTSSGGYPGIRGVGISFDALNQHLYVVDNDEYVNVYNTDGTVDSAANGGFPTVTSERFAGGNDIQVDAADGRVFVVQGYTIMHVYDLLGNVVSTSGTFTGLGGNVVYDPNNHRVYSFQNQVGGMMRAWDINGNAISLPGSSCYVAEAFAGIVVN